MILLYLLVIKSVVGIDDGTPKFGIQHFSLAVNLKDDRVAEFVLLGRSEQSLLESFSGSIGTVLSTNRRKWRD